jgi:Na+-transporting methylmalonyl-CoA/oxaloacetate decarboxylase gamma subunit
MTKKLIIKSGIGLGLLVLVIMFVTAVIMRTRTPPVGKKAGLVAPEKETASAKVQEQPAPETVIDVMLPKVRYIVPQFEVIIGEPELTAPVVTSVVQEVEVNVVVVKPSEPVCVRPERVVIHPGVRVFQGPPPAVIYSDSP